MVNALKGIPSWIVYVGVSLKNAVDSDKLGTALFRSRFGDFVAADLANVDAAVLATAAKAPPDKPRAWFSLSARSPIRSSILNTPS